MRSHPYGESPESLHAEDYELFTRMLSEGVGFCNIDEPLTFVRVNPGGVSLGNEQTQVDNFVTCANRHLERTLHVRLDPGIHRVLVNRMTRTVTGRELRDGLCWLGRFERSFLASEPESAQEIRDAAGLQRVDILLQAGLKARPGVRLLAGCLALRYSHRLLSARPRRYAASKLRPSRLMPNLPRRPEADYGAVPE